MKERELKLIALIEFFSEKVFKEITEEQKLKYNEKMNKLNSPIYDFLDNLENPPIQFLLLASLIENWETLLDKFLKHYVEDFDKFDNSKTSNKDNIH